MAIIVQKFGGTSVANTERIKHVGQIIRKYIENGAQPVVVVSAMAGVTNQLVSLCLEISRLTDFNLSEYDAALASGETVTAALLALYLQTIGISARSFHGWQIPIETNDSHGHGLITNIDTANLLDTISQGVVPIIAGFQGVNNAGRITTLGRGGSDTTAAAIAAALDAECCEIYTDTDGVYSADPRLVNHAMLIPALTHAEMLVFASLGAKVLHPRSVQIAMRYNIPMKVISSFTEHTGTIITTQKNSMENPKITGLTINHDFALVSVSTKSQQEIYQILQMITARGIKLYDIAFANNKTESLTFTTNLLNIAAIEKIVTDANAQIDEVNTTIAQLSIVGLGVNNSTDTLQIVMTQLAEQETHCYSINVGETSISCFVAASDCDRLLKSLHSKLIEDV